MKPKTRTLIKAFITVLLGMLLIIGIDCLIGFTLGGAAQKHLWYFIPLSLIFSFLAVLIIFGKEKFKEKKAPWAAVLAVALLAFIAFIGYYNVLNEQTSDGSYVEYKTTVNSTLYTRTHYFEVYFDDQNGNEGMDSVYTADYIFLSDEEEGAMLTEGDEITVREFEGGFHAPIYQVQELQKLRDENNEK